MLRLYCFVQPIVKVDLVMVLHIICANTSSMLHSPLSLLMLSMLESRPYALCHML